MKTEVPREQLIQSYINTSFIVKTETGCFEIRIGKRSPELDALMESKGQDTGCYITAFNPRSNLRSKAENAAMHKVLLEELAARRCDFYGGEGLPDDPNWEPEESVLILGISRIAAIGLGEKYGQNAIVFCRLRENAELVWCMGG